MKQFIAIEFRDQKETGRTETYLADTEEEAVGKVLYTRKLVDNSFQIGQSGKTVLNSNTTWVVLPESQSATALEKKR